MLFVFMGLDKPGMKETRAENRQGHLAYMKNTREPARHIIGMPLASDDEATMIGSLAIIDAPDRQAAETFMAGDPYAVAGIFATTSLTAIHPAFAAGDFKRILPKPE